MARRSSLGFDDVPGASYDEERGRRERRRSRRHGGWDDGTGDAGLMRVVCLLGVCAALVCLKLVYLQVFQHANLARQGEAIRDVSHVLRAKRGTIYDRNGNVLAISVECEHIAFHPSQISELKPEERQDAARMVAESLGGKAQDYLELFQGEYSEDYVYIRHTVDEQVASSLKEKLDEAGYGPAFELEQTIRRDHPYGNVGMQVLGLVGADGQGLTGLELYYDELLSGEDGTYTVQVSSDRTTPIASARHVIEPATDGQDIVIALDIDIQQVAEEQIAAAVKDYESDSGSVVVTDPQTGEILALCSTPLLDMDDYTDEAGVLKPVSASYEPGSIFKVLTAAIGIENGLIGAESTWTVPPEIQVGDDHVSDVDGRDYSMDMSLREIMRRSSNVGMALIAQRHIGAELFSQGVAAFHIGQLTGVDIAGESAGIVKGLSEYDGSTLGNMAFGQGLAMPMVQMVEAVGSIANGGTLITPHLLVSAGGEDVAWEPHGTSVSAQTCAVVTDLMRTVVDEGTAADADVAGYDVAAKTGTGQQVDEEHGGYKENSFVSSIIGFANADDPHVLVYVGLNGTAYHGSAVGGTFSAIMGEALLDCGVTPEG